MRAGQISDSYSYDPFGEITAVTHDGTAKTPLEAQNDNGLSDNDVLWGYNVEEYIEEVDLQYLRQRHYSPETGTFTSQDTNEGDLTNPLSQNRYIYAENDPVNGNDPGGDKKKSKKSSTKKTSKKSSKSSSKSSKKTSKKTNKKTTSKKSSSKKKASSKKSSSKKSGSLWNKLKTKAKSKVNKAKKAIKKKISSVKDKAKALKKSVTCKVKKVIKSGKTLLNNTKKLVRSGMTKVSNAYNKLKSGAKSALGYMGKSIKNFFVPESAYASSSSSSSTKKSAPKQTDLYQQILLSSQYYQYVQGGGTKSFDEFKNSSSVNNAVHGMLDLAGLLFDAADAINAAWYAAEGDYENAGISGMGIIPVIGIGKTGPRVAKTTKNMFKASEAGKVAEVGWTSHGYKHFPNKNMKWGEIVKSTKSGPAKYSPEIKNVQAFERDAWKTGIPVTNGKSWKVKSYDSVIGAASGKETKYVRIEMSGGTIHGHPISESEYHKLIK